jgi:hypothetical protein
MIENSGINGLRDFNYLGSMWSGSSVDIDGVVKSPIYCVAAIFQVLDIPYRIVSHLKNYYALYIEIFT